MVSRWVAVLEDGAGNGCPHAVPWRKGVGDSWEGLMVLALIKMGSQQRHIS